MADKFVQFFTEGARRVMKIAEDEAQRLKQRFVGTEHLLVGLIREEQGVAGHVLRDLGLQTAQVQMLIERFAGVRQSVPSGQLELAPRTKRVLEIARDEASRMGAHRIDTEHILLALVRLWEGVPANVFDYFGITGEQVRQQTVQNLRARPEPEPDVARTASGGSRAKTPLVDQLTIDLTALAEQGKLDPIVGRTKEIERVIQILARRTKNNPALIGQPGVGKTAIVEGLAQRIVAGETPDPLLGKRVLQLDVGSLVAGTMYRGQFEERLKKVIGELKSSGNIVFIDEVHMLVGAGAAGSSVDAANILKPALARGELQCIGATTLDEYRKHIESDAALERRFQPVFVDEPSVEDTIEILRGIKRVYEQHHRVHISDEALQTAARLSARYISDRYLPDKAIDVIDEASSRVRMYKAPRARSLQDTMEALHDVRHKKWLAAEEERQEDADELGMRELELEERLDTLRSAGDLSAVPVAESDMAEIVSMWTGIPLIQLEGSESTRLLHMEEELAKRIVGQEDALRGVAKAVRRGRAGLKDPRRPIGSFIFLGPTGVGKTELTKALASFMFGSEDALIQLDMSEFMERHTVSRLVGAPPGYVGYEEAGQLTEAIRRRPYSIVVFDEVEKAHPEAFNMLLQVMEEGVLSDARGHKVDFRNTIVIMTSNVGADLIKRQSRLGFSVPSQGVGKGQRDYDDMRKLLMEELKRTFRPEFLNRVDNVVVFRALDREDIIEIARLEIDKVGLRLIDQGLHLEATEAACEYLADKGYSDEYGARPLRRLIQSEVEDALSDAVLACQYEEGCVLLVDVAEDEAGGRRVVIREREVQAATPEKQEAPAVV